MSDALFVQPVKVAVIDDNIEFGIGIKILLSKEEVEVHTAANGLEGLELVKQLLPDIVLLDVIMPGIDGIEVCKKIRQTPEMKGAYIIMLSGVNIQSDQMAEGIEAGADGYIARPIPNRELLARLRVFIHLKRTEKALHESEERFRVAQEMSPDGFTILHPLRNKEGEIVDFTWIYENQTVARTNNTNPQEVVGKRLLDLFPEHYGTSVFEKYLDVANTGKSQIIEEVFVGEIISKPTWLRLVVVSMGEDIAILSQDITERKQAEEALRKSEAQFRTIFDIASLGIAQVDPTNGRIILINTYYETITGYRIDELLKMTFLELTHPDDREKDWEVFSKAARGEIEYRNEKRYVKKDGRIVWVRIHLAFIRDEKGKPKRTVAICEDITKHKQAEDALRESEKEFRNLIEFSPIAMALIHDWKTIYFNPAAIQLFGAKTQNELLGRHIFEFIHPDFHEPTAEHAQLLAEKGFVNMQEQKYLKLDGSILDVEAMARSIRFNNAAATLVVINDITERKHAEEALRQSEERYRMLAKNTLDVIWVLSMDIRFTYVNQAIETMFGYRPDEWIGSGLWEHCDEKQFSRLKALIEKEVAKGPNQPGIIFEAQMLRRDRSTIDVEIHGKVIFNDQGLPVSLQGVTRDITERKKSEEALHSSEAQYRLLFENNPLPMLIYDLETLQIMAVNETAVLKYGYSEEEFLAMTIKDLRPQQDIPALLENIAAATGVLQESSPWRHKTKQGDIILVEIISHSINYSGQAARLVISNDITQRKLAESIRLLQHNIAQATITAKNLNELINSVLKELNSIIDAKNLFIALYNEETGKLYSPFSKDDKDDIREWPAKKSLTGYLIKQGRTLLLRKNEILRLHEEGIIELFGTISEAWLGVPLKAEEKMLGAIVVQNYDNSEAYDKTSIEVMELVAHEVSNFIDRQDAKEKATKLSRAVEQSSVSVMITNREGIIEYVNPFFTELTGYSFDEAKGKNPKILKSGYQPKAFYQELWSTILSGNNWDGELLNKKKNGELFWEKAVISPIVNRDGDITNFVTIKEDITESKQMLKELLAAKEKAEESDRLKTAFLNNISHEVRTPMNGILGFTQLLTDPDVSQEEREYFARIINQSGKQLLSIIEDIINIATIEAGQEKLRELPIDINHMLETTYTQFKDKINNKNINLNYRNYLSQAKSVIIADETKLVQVITNLLNNAIKFTRVGKIEFQCKPYKDFLKFSVEDTGIGIAKEYHDLIFERFRQLTPDPAMAYEGNGLGLAISKAYVELMGGKMWVESEPGKGSAFYFTIPYKPVDYSNPLNEEIEIIPHLNGEALKARTILLAEDEFSNSMLIEMILKPYGIDLIHVTNGKDAVEEFRKNRDIDVVLMDLKMPLMDGEEATKIIKKTKPDLPVIAITAYAQSGDRAKTLEAGFDDYIGKPVKKDDLISIIKKHLRKPQL